MTWILIVAAALALLALAAHTAWRFYTNKIAEAFAMGVDFGKAIALMTEDAKAAIAELHLPDREPRAAANRDIPAAREPSE